MMMGLPRSLDPRVEIISGNTGVEAGDSLPTRNIWRMRTRPLPNAIFRGDASVPACMYADAITMELPEQREYAPRHEGINYTEETNRPLAMNEFEVPDEELVKYNDLVAASLPDFKNLLYRGVSLLNAVGDSLDYTEAALRDGLGIDTEMDRAILDAYIPIARLDMVSQIIARTHMNKDSQLMFMTKITELFAEKTILAFDKHDAGRAARRAFEMTQEAHHARVSAQEKGQPIQQPTHNSRFGVTGQRR